jgi:hypothetical protein
LFRIFAEVEGVCAVLASHDARFVVGELVELLNLYDLFVG